MGRMYYAGPCGLSQPDVCWIVMAAAGERGTNPGSIPRFYQEAGFFRYEFPSSFFISFQQLFRYKFPHISII